MSLQVCPRCEKKTFTWKIDEEFSKFTLWSCDACGYEAEEDESQEMICSACGQKRGSSLLKDKEGYHRWCFDCGRFAPTVESF